MCRVTKETSLICQREPTAKERKENGAEIVFEREDDTGQIYIIYGCVLYESWQQWGEIEKILWDNVNDIEKWRIEQKNT